MCFKRPSKALDVLPRSGKPGGYPWSLQPEIELAGGFSVSRQLVGLSHYL